MPGSKESDDKPLTIRPMRPEDEPEIRSLHEQFSDFPLPNFSDPHYVLRRVVEHDGKILAAVAARKTAEVVMIMDLDAPVSQRCAAVQGLLEDGIFEANGLGIDEFHVFLTGEVVYSFERLLRKRFGFVPAEGVPLVLHLGGNRGKA